MYEREYQSEDAEVSVVYCDCVHMDGCAKQKRVKRRGLKG
jgi:hypothetical protein